MMPAAEYEWIVFGSSYNWNEVNDDDDTHTQPHNGPNGFRSLFLVRIDFGLFADETAICHNRFATYWKISSSVQLSSCGCVRCTYRITRFSVVLLWNSKIFCPSLPLSSPPIFFCCRCSASVFIFAVINSFIHTFWKGNRFRNDFQEVEQCTSKVGIYCADAVCLCESVRLNIDSISNDGKDSAVLFVGLHFWYFSSSSESAMFKGSHRLWWFETIWVCVV